MLQMRTIICLAFFPCHRGRIEYNLLAGVCHRGKLFACLGPQNESALKLNRRYTVLELAEVN